VAPGTCPVLVKQGRGRGDRKTLLSHFGLLGPLDEELTRFLYLYRRKFDRSAATTLSSIASAARQRIRERKNQQTY
jgi:hypothetical protein